MNNLPEKLQKIVKEVDQQIAPKLAEIEDPLMKEIRYLDKLIDELAKGKVMEKILRNK